MAIYGFSPSRADPGLLSLRFFQNLTCKNDGFEHKGGGGGSDLHNPPGSAHGCHKVKT